MAKTVIDAVHDAREAIPNDLKRTKGSFCRL